MNIFNKVALQGLLKSRSRTLVTIIGVMLSAALMIGVATFATSLQHYLINGSIAKYGDWHVGLLQADEAPSKLDDDRIERSITFENIGYAALTQSKNEHKPYLFVAGFVEESYEGLPIKLTAGRYPKNDTELIVPSHLKDNGEVTLAIGDSITLGTGQRVAKEQLLAQDDAYKGQDEAFVIENTTTYTVVGTFTRPAFEPSSAPGYTAITTVNALSGNHFSTFIKMKNPRQAHAYAEALQLKHVVYNEEVLRFMGLSNDTLFNTLLFSVGAILVVLIMLGSVLLIYNAFTISLNERMRQLGILLSVGATPRQLRNSVLFEGLCIGLVGIPLGMMIGIPSVGVVLSLVEKNFSNVAYSGVPLSLHVSLPILFIALAISFITIVLSAYIPARKAVKTPIMTCIRQTNEIKVDVKDIKTNQTIERLLGLERTLALKNFKRNKRRYRTIVLSLTLSVVMFVSASAFKTTLQQVASSSAIDTDYDLLFVGEQMQEDEASALFQQFQRIDAVYDGSYQAMIDYFTTVRTEDLTNDFKQALQIEAASETVEIGLDVQFLEDRMYEAFLQQLGFDRADYTGVNAKAIAVAKIMPEHKTGYEDVFTKPSMTFALTNVLVAPYEVDITFVETYPIDPLPKQRSHVQPYTFMLVVPYGQLAEWGLDGQAMERGLTFQSKDTTTAAAEMAKIAQAQHVSTAYTIFNANEIFEQNRNIIFIIDLFTIVFIVLISLIAVANVFNTISTNIRLRRRELAMLRSIGMSDGDFNKMMRFECALYGLQTLVFGLPLSALLAWLIYKGMAAGGANVAFVFPWTSMTISLIGVFIIIFITTLYALSQIKKENIIDALRDDLQ